jgi:hypothetical protein
VPENDKNITSPFRNKTEDHGLENPLIDSVSASLYELKAHDTKYYYEITFI